MYNTKELDVYLESLFKEKQYPGLSICLRGPEGIIFEKGYGYCDIKKNRPVGVNTIFGIASMSKSMTTLACAILETEGKLSFSDPVVKYFPQFSIPGTPRESVTLRHLAMHTAGIPPIPPLEWSIVMNTPQRHSEASRKLRENAPNKMDKIEYIIDYIANSGAYEPLGAPGECMSYSNDAYALLSYVVDQAAGISLEEFLNERIFKPLSMTRTVLDLDGKEAIFLANGDITDLFDLDDDGNLYSDQIWSVLPPYRGCACVKSTARDITKYYQMLSQNGKFEGKQIIDPKAVEILIGREFPETRYPFYCFGLNKRLFNGHVICEHSGGLHGVSTNGGLIMGGYSMTALCNQGDISAEPFIWACYNLILGLPLSTSHSFAIPSGNKFSIPEAVIGTYISREAVPSYCIVTKDEDSNLFAKYYDEDLKLYYCEETLFSARNINKPDEQRTTMRFLIRNGKAWGVRCYNRVFQRIE
jgi:CubicO group peptidase (beta-lactamase class C family)